MSTAPRQEAPWRGRRWHYRRSLASRVALLTTAAVGMSIAMMALVTFFVMRHQLQSEGDQSLLNRAERASTSGALSEFTVQGAPSWMLGAADVSVIFINAERNVVISADQPNFNLGTPELDVARGNTTESIRTIEAEDGLRYRVAAVPAGDGQALVLAQPMTSQQRALAKLGTVMLLTALFGMLAAALAGWGVATNGLRPVRRLTRGAEKIAVTEDLTPLRVEGDDEVARLATAFNRMLAALAASRDRQRRLVADAGHELRTPLTSLRTNLDLLAQASSVGGFPDAARLELMADVRAQVIELTTLVGDLVVLARDEQPVLEAEELDLAEVIDRAAARVRRRATSARFEVCVESALVRGDATALERAVTNLLDNAAKWSPAGGTIRVSLEDGVLTVSDEGPGISPTDRPRVFDRFWRSDESRSMPGSGLGLAIVRQVVEQHGGQVRVDESPSGGAQFSVWIPAAG